MMQAFVADVDILGSLLGCWRCMLDVGSGMFLFWCGPFHEGGDLLARGCAQCTKVPPTGSALDPPAVVPDPRAAHAQGQ